jgi:hypothetical protein
MGHGADSNGKKIRDTELVPVVLDLVQDVDAGERAMGKRIRDMKKEAVARLCSQAYEQGGCMTATEIAVLLKMSAGTVGKYIAEFEREQSRASQKGDRHGADADPQEANHRKALRQAANRAAGDS